MGNFNRDNNSGGRGSYGNRSYGSGGSDRETFKATCADCGKECDLPFRPTTGRPVYCRDDFKKHSPDEGRGRDAGRGNDRGGSRSFSRDNSRGGDREMFDAVCANCGNKCQVPFQPRGDKEVLCSNCFEEKGGDPRRSSNNASSSQLNDIQAKLDRILELLSPAQKEIVNKKPKAAPSFAKASEGQEKSKPAPSFAKASEGQEDEMVEEITEAVIEEMVSEPVISATVKEVVEVKKPKAKKKLVKSE